MSGFSFQQQLREHLQRLQQTDRLRSRRTVTALDATTCQIDGRTCVSFASNDYLALSWHPDVLAALHAGAQRQVGAGASALVAGRSKWHTELEVALADFEHTESALLFPSGYAANFGTLTSLVTAHDAVFCDRDNHASIIDGCRAAAGRMFVYRRDQLDQLNDSLARRRKDYNQIFIVTDTVFSMDGTVAPLARLCDIAAANSGVMIVDEAHATGVFGATGGGLCQQLGLESHIPVRIGTLSKAIGALGGFVAGSQALTDVLWNTARSQFFSTALPPAICAAAIRSLQILRDDHDRRDRLHRLCRHVRDQLQGAELATIPESVGPIIPVLVGRDDRAVDISHELLQAGFFVPAIRPPTVPRGTARLRISINCEHTESQVEALLVQLRKHIC